MCPRSVPRPLTQNRVRLAAAASSRDANIHHLDARVPNPAILSGFGLRRSSSLCYCHTAMRILGCVSSSCRTSCMSACCNRARAAVPCIFCLRLSFSPKTCSTGPRLFWDGIPVPLWCLHLLGCRASVEVLTAFGVLLARIR